MWWCFVVCVVVFVCVCWSVVCAFLVVPLAVVPCVCVSCGVFMRLRFVFCEERLVRFLLWGRGVVLCVNSCAVYVDYSSQ